MNNWTPQQVGRLTLRQLKIYLMKIDGIGGVEWLGREFATKAGRKTIQQPIDKAIENLKQGKRIDIQDGD